MSTPIVLGNVPPGWKVGAPPVYVAGQVLTAAELNASFLAKCDNANANITGGQIQGLTYLQIIGTTQSVDTQTGAETIVGGLGVGGNINGGGDANFAGDGSYGGDLTVDGALNIIGGTNADGVVNGVNNPNLLNNSSGEFGTVGWTLATGFGLAIDSISGAGVGFMNSTANANGTSVSPQVPFGPALPVTLSVDVANKATAGTVTVNLAAYSAVNVLISNVVSQAVPNGAALGRLTYTGTTPANTAYLVLQVVTAGVTAAVGSVLWRRAKIERGAVASLYSQEASMNYVQQVAIDAAITYSIALG